MLTVKEVSELTGVSIRTLHYYDHLGLLYPTKVTEAGYRLYDDIALERLQQILLFRELQFPLKDIQKILESKEFDRVKALNQQIELLTLKKEHIDNLIRFAREIRTEGVKKMNFKVFDTAKMDAYAQKAKEQWGETSAYKEFEIKNEHRTKKDYEIIQKEMMAIFSKIGNLMEKEPKDSSVQELVKELQQFITKYFYNCTNEILNGLGKMYGAGGEFTENIDRAGGPGCAEFTSKAIEYYCQK